MAAVLGQVVPRQLLRASGTARPTEDEVAKTPAAHWTALVIEKAGWAEGWSRDSILGTCFLLCRAWMSTKEGVDAAINPARFERLLQDPDSPVDWLLTDWWPKKPKNDYAYLAGATPADLFGMPDYSVTGLASFYYGRHIWTIPGLPKWKNDEDEALKKQILDFEGLVNIPDQTYNNAFDGIKTAYDAIAKDPPGSLSLVEDKDSTANAIHVVCLFIVLKGTNGPPTFPDLRDKNKKWSIKTTESAPVLSAQARAITQGRVSAVFPG
jgi:hypothetical protein